MVLLVLLDEAQPELGDKCSPSGKGELGLGRVPFRPALRRVLCHERQGEADKLLLRGFAVLDERLGKEPSIGPNRVEEGTALGAVAVKDERGVRSKDRFCARNDVGKYAWIQVRSWSRGQDRGSRGRGSVFKHSSESFEGRLDLSHALLSGSGSHDRIEERGGGGKIGCGRGRSTNGVVRVCSTKLRNLDQLIPRRVSSAVRATSRPENTQES